MLLPAITGQILLVLLLSTWQALHLQHEQARYGVHRLWYQCMLQSNGLLHNLVA